MRRPRKRPARQRCLPDPTSRWRAGRSHGRRSPAKPRATGSGIRNSLAGWSPVSTLRWTCAAPSGSACCVTQDGRRRCRWLERRNEQGHAGQLAVKARSDPWQVASWRPLAARAVPTRPHGTHAPPKRPPTVAGVIRAAEAPRRAEPPAPPTRSGSAWRWPSGYVPGGRNVPA